jgi:hypothetical protein
MNWKALITQIAMIALSSNPATMALAPLVAPAVIATEALLASKTGAEKLANATQLVKTGLADANVVHPGVVNTVVTDALIQDAISTVVDSANLIHRSAVGQLPIQTDHQTAVQNATAPKA